MFSTTFLMVSVLVLRDQIITPFIALFLISSFFFMGRPKSRRELILPIAGLAFYLLLVISLFYTNNIETAGLKLMTTFSIPLFSIVSLFTTKGFKPLLKGLIYGIIVSAFLSMTLSFFRAVITEGGLGCEAFSAHNYKWNIHPSYLSLILLFAAFLIWQVKSKLSWFKFMQWGYTLLTLVSIFYLKSLGAVICVMMAMIIVPVWQTIRSKNWRWLLMLPAYLALAFAAIKASPQLNLEVNSGFEKIANWAEDPDEYIRVNGYNVESIAVRIVTWTFSAELIKEHPVGVGIGDVQDELEAKFIPRGYSRYADRHLNPHNQYFQTSVAIGWPGLISLILIFFLLIRYALRLRNLTLFVTSLSLATSCLFESMLERQVGVIMLAILVLFTVIQIKQQAQTAE